MYLQDDWKINARTTLNMGLRWDYQPPVTVKDDLTVSAFDDVSTNPLQSQLPQGAATINPATGQPMTLIGGLEFANRGGPKSPYQGDWNNIQPRIGISFKINNWLVARSNYGRSYLGLSSGGQAGVYTTDFQRTTPFIATAPNGIDPGTQWANPFPDGFLLPLAGELGLLTALGTGPTIPNRDYEIPYTDQWMAGVDIQLPYQIGLDVAYVGNRVSKLGVTRSINSIPKSENDKAIPSLGGNTGYLNQTFPNPFAGLVPGQGINADTIARSQLLRPYPHFTGGLSMNRLNMGSAYYSALEAVATKRYTNGVMFAINYTLMKLEDQINFFTEWDETPYRDIQGDQRRNRLVITTLVDLPFGPGKRFGGDTTGIVANLIGGWQFNAIGEIQSGRPLALNGSAVQLDPDVALPKDQQSFEKWFDNSSTSLNNPREDGTFAWSVLGTNEYRVAKQRFHDVNEPTEPQWSVSLFKNNTIGRANLQLRIETFNVFNTRVYGGAEHQPGQRELRRRRYREPGELPTDDPTGGSGAVLARKMPPLMAETRTRPRGRERRCAPRFQGQRQSGVEFDSSILSKEATHAIAHVDCRRRCRLLRGRSHRACRAAADAATCTRHPATGRPRRPARRGWPTTSRRRSGRTGGCGPRWTARDPASDAGRSAAAPTD